jgi:hypothetical protein
VWNIFFLNTPCFDILVLLLFWRGSCFLFLFFSMLFDWSTLFSMLLEHILFFSITLSPFARLQEEKSL